MCQWSGKHITMLGPRQINRSSLSWGRAFERAIFLGFSGKMFYESSFQLRKGCSGVSGDCTRHTAHAAVLERWRTLWGLASAGTCSTVERVIQRCRGFVHVWSFRALLFRVHMGIFHQTVDVILFSFFRHVFFFEVLLFLEILLLPPVTPSFFLKFIGDLERSDNWTLQWGGSGFLGLHVWSFLSFWFCNCEKKKRRGLKLVAGEIQERFATLIKTIWKESQKELTSPALRPFPVSPIKEVTPPQWGGRKVWNFLSSASKKLKSLYFMNLLVLWQESCEGQGNGFF